MGTTERPHVAVETMHLIRAEAARLGLPLTDLLEAAVEQAVEVTAPEVAARAHRELGAYRAGHAVRMADVRLPASAATLCVRGGSWVDERITGEVARAGYGVRIGAGVTELGNTLRGFHRVRPLAGATRMVLFRRGVPVVHGWGDDWGEIEHEGRIRRFARRMLVSDGSSWVDIDSGTVSSALDAEDHAVESALKDLVVTFSPGNRNPVFWAGAQR